MRRPTLDPTAGRRARAISARPGAPRVIEDPTDPRYGDLTADGSWQAVDAPRILDPTDPEYGEDAV